MHFFLEWSAVELDLHSFPTRRSSDLERVHFALNCMVVGCPRLPRAAFSVEEAWEDRKSTRLNSSHVAISYAVFCLKKKNLEAHHTNCVRLCNCSNSVSLMVSAS